MKAKYRAKLNIKKKRTLTQFKRMAGAYRRVYNFCIDYQLNRVLNTNYWEKKFLTGEELLEVAKSVKEEKFPFFKDLDGGIFYSAVAAASKAFSKKFDYHLDSIPFLSRKERNMMFKTKGKVKFLEKSVVIPKLGSVPMYERGYIPTDSSEYSNITFKHDGVDWFVSVDVEVEEPVKPELKGEISVDFTLDGDLVLNGYVFKSCLPNDNYKAATKRYRGLSRKLERQRRANSIPKGNSGATKTVTTNGMKKTQEKLAKTKRRIHCIIRDYQNRVISDIVNQHPKVLHVLTDTAISRTRNGYLSRKQREAEVPAFFRSLKIKLTAIGTVIQQHESLDFF